MDTAFIAELSKDKRCNMAISAHPENVRIWFKKRSIYGQVAILKLTKSHALAHNGIAQPSAQTLSSDSKHRSVPDLRHKARSAYNAITMASFINQLLSIFKPSHDSEPDKGIRSRPHMSSTTGGSDSDI
jgi:hypothetical protein